MRRTACCGVFWLSFAPMTPRRTVTVCPLFGATHAAALHRTAEQEQQLAERAREAARLADELERVRQDAELRAQQVAILTQQGARREALLSERRDEAIELQRRLAEQQLQIAVVQPAGESGKQTYGASTHRKSDAWYYLGKNSEDIRIFVFIC